VGADEYELEVDGELIKGITDPSYTHVGLIPNSKHSYRVRALNHYVTSTWSGWSEAVTQTTPPGTPESLQAEATTETITLTWASVTGATSYDVEVDGNILTIYESSYIHDNLKPNTMHVYRVRANNAGGTGDWTELLKKSTTPELEVNVGQDTMFNFVFVVPQKAGMLQRRITVTYDPDQLEVLDLSALTPNAELEVGSIKGTSMTVIDFKEGNIVYFVDQAESTIFNSIRFLAKTNEYSKVTYTVE
jgi:hypothetical protein